MARTTPRDDAPTMRAARWASAASAGAVLTAVLAACTAVSTPTSPTTPAAGPSEDATASPVLVVDGTAGENLPLFTEVVAQVWASESRAEGRAYVDALVGAGFAKADMEVTDDETTVGNAADAIQFSVRWQGECLVGQVGPSTATPTAVVLPLTPEGRCLIGTTRTIDW